MQIKLKWLPRAIALLDDIYEYYSEKSEDISLCRNFRTFIGRISSEFPLPGCRKTLQADLHHQSNPDRDTRHMGLQAG